MLRRSDSNKQPIINRNALDLLNIHALYVTKFNTAVFQVRGRGRKARCLAITVTENGLI